MTKFQKGQSGNPGGRPKAEREVIRLARAASPAAVKRLVELVKSDDPRAAIAAANAVLDRAFGKGRGIDLTLPAIKTPADIVGALGSIAAAVAGGQITPEEGTAVASLLEAQRRAVETVEIEARLSALEGLQQ